LLTLDRRTGGLGHDHFSSVPELLREGDLLVVNRSRVVPARLLGHTAGGGRAEVLYLFPEPTNPDHFRALVRPGRRLKEGAEVRLGDSERCIVVAVHPDGARTMRFDGHPKVLDLLNQLGHLPLPPYIDRADTPLDRERYQTIYAREPGSVAAPTAGLHFTESVMNRLRKKGVEVQEIMLHVGPGTFARVDAENIADHRVPPEPYLVPEDTAAAHARARRTGGRVVAVGTTTVRTLESAFRDGELRSGPGETDLVIRPGYGFGAIDALVTNFHLPKSSLLFLVSAFAGIENIRAAYAEAISERYRFYSYGDAMFIR
jgi:S-adenosylmethionine:tRNA ribosyltransferase-isomerase